MLLQPFWGRSVGNGHQLQGTERHGRPRLQKQVRGEEEAPHKTIMPLESKCRAAKENFFDQRVKALRPIDQRYPYEVHNKAGQIGTSVLQ